jgi:hypothetical protein
VQRENLVCPVQCSYIKGCLVIGLISGASLL